MRPIVLYKVQFTALLILTVTCVVAAAASGIECNRFKILANVAGSVLDLSVDTDLPDNTDVMVDVSRSYFQKGNRDQYSVEYFMEKGTIGKWKSKHNISIDGNGWKSALKAEQKRLAAHGLGFDVASISDKIEVSMIVPYNQSDPRFGKQNSNLTGKAVKISSDYRTVQDKIEIKVPLQSPPVGKSQFSNIVRANPFKLDIGRTYNLSRQTPFMPPNSPSDPFEAIKHLKQIPQGGAIKILRIVKDNGNPKYEVIALDTTGQAIGRGLVTSNALVGQDLEICK